MAYIMIIRKRLYYNSVVLTRSTASNFVLAVIDEFSVCVLCEPNRLYAKSCTTIVFNDNFDNEFNFGKNN